tara:strand:+ start:301 stop:678 length:378 start_codon:yes stop_codon:yes gene_type:complete
MANPPNIVNVAKLFGKTKTNRAIPTTATEIMPAVASDYVHKINLIFITNIDGTNNCDVTIWIAEDTDETKLAHTITIPADSSLTLLDTPLYINYNATGTGNRLMALAQTAGDLDITVSWEEISDV